MTAQDGGAAFPGCVRGDKRALIRNPGMSLRDYFAGQALAGLVGEYAKDMRERARKTNQNWSFSDLERDGRSDEPLAWTAYEIADAMLAARTEGGA